jgi:hypothetical protein
LKPKQIFDTVFCMKTKPSAKLTKVIANIKTPFLNIQGEWAADESQQRAAWELYVELVTRISVVELKPGEGLLREALTSLHDLFGETRQILRKYGPVVARPKGQGKLSFGVIAVTVLNSALRPVLAKWHPLLMTYENTRGPGISPADHEAKWEHNEELRKILSDLQETMKQYSLLLAEAAGVPPIETTQIEKQ